MEQTAEIYLILKKSYSLKFSKFCGKNLVFFALCLAKIGISEESKDTRAKMIRIKTVENEISYLIESNRIFLGSIVFKIFSSKVKH